MENRQPVIPALRPIEDTDVTTWELPEGAIGRLGQGVLLDYVRFLYINSSLMYRGYKPYRD